MVCIFSIMKLEDAFERIYVINLATRGERRERLEKHLLEAGVADPGRVTWVRAMSGDLIPPPTWWGAGNGAWGCLMSHMRIGQDAVHDQLESCCVLEDDVVFHPRAAGMMDRFMKELPADWGQVYLGGQFLHKNPEQVSPWVMRPYNVNRTHAYALSKRIIPRFLQHIMHAPDYYRMELGENGKTKVESRRFHIDHQLGRAHERRIWNTYAPTWWLAGQEAGSSNISGRVNPQYWWQVRGRSKTLPFFFLPADASPAQRQMAGRHLHCGNHLLGDSLVDTGLNKELTDEQLTRWLKLIAAESMDHWKLPGFEVPAAHPGLPTRVHQLWEPGLLDAQEPLMKAVGDYPFNGFCGGVAG
jgi:hypothetical protein